MTTATRELTLPGIETQTVERFRAFHGRHPEVYRTICEKARLLKGRGHKRYSIFALINIVRFHADVAADKSEQFKINNCYAPHYARLIMQQEKDLGDFFELRALKGEAVAA